ncbi:hypothetical protein Tco_0783304 [Tanacetum coccineum]
MDDLELIFPYEAMGSPNPPPPDSDTSSESEPEDIPAATLDLEDLMPSYMRRDIDSLHGSVRVLTGKMSTREAADTVAQSRDREILTLDERIQKLEEDGVRGENMRLRMMLKSAEESVMFARMERDRTERDLYELRV